MGVTVERTLAWTTAFVVVFSLYAHTVFETASTEVTPISAAVIATGLAVSSLLWFRHPVFWTPRYASRQAGACVLVAAWALFTALGLVAFQERAPTVYDWGLFLLTVGAPLLILLSHERMTLLRAVGWWCVMFALADAVANFGGLYGWWEVSDAGARFTEAGRIQRFGGLTGNSHAGGIVCLVAICCASVRAGCLPLPDRRTKVSWRGPGRHGSAGAAVGTIRAAVGGGDRPWGIRRRIRIHSLRFGEQSAGGPHGRRLAGDAEPFLDR